MTHERVALPTPKFHTEAGAPEPEVNPEMIEAGVRTYWRHPAIEPSSAEARELVSDIYRAMVSARKACP